MKIHRRNNIPGLLSLLAHIIVVSTLLVLSVDSNRKPVNIADGDTQTEPITLSIPPGIGATGGGGTKAPTPASKGILPRAADQQLVPPSPVITHLAPELIAEPTIVALAQQPILPKPGIMPPLGEPSGVPGPPSSGPGGGGGIGDGDGHGDGRGKGPGFLSGENATTPSTGVVRIGALGASAPTCPLPPSEPNYTDDARKANIQGTVTLEVIINRDGSVSVSKIAHGIGYGLDDEASQFVAKSFRCKPGIYQGQAVATPGRIEVRFHLY